MSTKAAVLIQTMVVILASIAAGVVHSTAKPISRTLTPTEPTSPSTAQPAGGPAQADATPPTATTPPSQPRAGNTAPPLNPPTTPALATTPATASPAGSNSHDKLPPGTFCTLEQAKQLLDDQAAEFIDARNPDEFAAGAIPTAFNIPPDAFAGGNFPPYLNTIAPDRKIIVYCGGGDCDASLLVALKIKGFGFKDVIVFKEGYNGWTAAKLPTTGGAK